MKGNCLKRFTDSLAHLANVAVIPTLPFASTPVENTANDDVAMTEKVKDSSSRHNLTLRNTELRK